MCEHHSLRIIFVCVEVYFLELMPALPRSRHCHRNQMDVNTRRTTMEIVMEPRTERGEQKSTENDTQNAQKHEISIFLYEEKKERNPYVFYWHHLQLSQDTSQWSCFDNSCVLTSLLLCHVLDKLARSPAVFYSCSGGGAGQCARDGILIGGNKSWWMLKRFSWCWTSQIWLKEHQFQPRMPLHW